MTTSESYLKTRQVAKAFGVSASTIKRWVDSGALKATRTVGKHRLIPLSEVLRFARENNLQVTGPEQAASGRPKSRPLDERLLDELTLALRRGRAREARALILAGHASDGAVRLADGLIRPALERIGHDWESQSLDVFQEHRASRIVETALMELLRRSIRGGGDSLPLALVAGPEDDLYTIPGLLCELALRELGWEVTNLGANLPLYSLARAVLAQRPKLVCLSVSHVAEPRRFLNDYTDFYKTAATTGTAVILGGQGLTPDLRTRIVAASFGDRMSHLAEFARRLCPETTPRPGSQDAVEDL